MGVSATISLVTTRSISDAPAWHERHPCGSRQCSGDATWPKHRILFLLAGGFTLMGTVLAAKVSRRFAVLPALVGANQLLLVATGWCPASAVLDRVLPAARQAADERHLQRSQG